MNQPAAKEPTMDEILSSIRQIIADDDESAAQKVPAAAASGAKAAEPQPSPVIDPFSDDDEDEVPALALSPEQIINDGAAAEPDEIVAPEPEMPSAASLEAVAEMVVPDDVAFAQDMRTCHRSQPSSPRPSLPEFCQGGAYARPGSGR